MVLCYNTLVKLQDEFIEREFYHCLQFGPRVGLRYNIVTRCLKPLKAEQLVGKTKASPMLLVYFLPSYFPFVNPLLF